MAWQLACTERDWCDFVIYDPRLPENQQLWIMRFEPTKQYIAELEKKVSVFLEELRERVRNFEENINANFESQSIEDVAKAVQD
jgi:hypothetical protein